MPPPRGGSIAWLRLVQAGETGLRSVGGRLEDGAPEAAVGLEEGRGVMGAPPERLAPVEDTLDTGVVLGREVGMTIDLLGGLPSGYADGGRSAADRREDTAGHGGDGPVAGVGSALEVAAGDRVAPGMAGGGGEVRWSGADLRDHAVCGVAPQVLATRVV